ncbi:MAG: hypothetical protein ACNYPE_05450 [Candidatus Azotimanducaceae bacterium WSBS_2022_MAG_OTU7]
MFAVLLVLLAGCSSAPIEPDVAIARNHRLRPAEPKTRPDPDDYPVAPFLAILYTSYWWRKSPGIAPAMTLLSTNI